MGGSSNSPPPTQTTQQVLSPEQRSLFNLAMPGVTNFASQPAVRYPGTQVAPFNELQDWSQQLALDAAGRQAGTQRAAAGTQNFWLGGPGGGGAADVFNPNTNPYIQQAISGAITPIENRLMRTVLPGIRSEAAGVGGYGGSRQGIAEGIAIGDATRSAQEAAGRITTDLAQQFADNQLKAIALTPTIQAAQQTPAATVANVGDIRQQMTQAQMDEAARNFNFDQYGDFLKSRDILALLGAIPGGSVVSTGSTPNQGPTWQKSLGGALTGASAGSAFGPWGAGIGALGGAALPFLFA